MTPDDRPWIINCDSDDPLKKLALEIINRRSWSRIDMHGGYPDEVSFIGNKIVVASLAHNGAPELTIATIRQFVKENDFWLDEDEEMERAE